MSEKAFELLKTHLRFDEVKLYTNLSQGQIIEKMDMLQFRADKFENKKKLGKRESHERLTLPFESARSSMR